MPGLKRRFYISLILLFLLIALSSCDSIEQLNTRGESSHDAAFLTLEIDRLYGVKEIKPGAGRYRYEPEAIAEIKLIANPGYEVIGWAGIDGGDVIKVSDQNYKLTMSDNKRIRTNLRYNEFLLLDVKFNDIKTVEFNKLNNIIEIPHTIENINFRFNNKVSEENDLTIWIEAPDSEEENSVIRDFNFSISDNQIIIDIQPWFENFIELYFEGNDEENEINNEFEKEYILNIESNFANNIFDSSNKEYNEEIISLSFQIEEPNPKTPEIIGLSKDNGDVEISWHRTESVTKFAVEDYVEEYIIQRSRNNQDFEDNITEISVAVDLFDESERPVKIHRYIDSEINLNNNIYYYRVIAVNQFDNRSEPSDIKSTETLN